MEHRRFWEKRWAASSSFSWQTSGGGGALAMAVDDGWLRPGSEILDAGCGSGEHAAWLAGRGFTVLGFDFAEPAIERARKEHGSVERLSFLVADATSPRTLPERTFDAVLDRGCFHGTPERSRPGHVANLARWTRPGGTLLLGVKLSGMDADAWRQEMDRLLGRDFVVEDAVIDPTLAHGGRPHGIMFRLTRRGAGTRSSPSTD